MGTAIASHNTAVERIVKNLLDEVTNAYHQGDKQFLDLLGISAAEAQAVDKIDKRRLARLLTLKDGALDIRVDQDVLGSLLDDACYDANQIRQRRELINAGATHAMLNELGFYIVRDGGSQRDAISGLCKTHPTGFPSGRPPTLELDMIRELHEYWASIRNPGRINPIDHLLRTAEHLDIRVVSIWNYIQTYPRSQRNPPPPGVPDWVTVVFPHWPEQNKPSQKLVSRRH